MSQDRELVAKILDSITLLASLDKKRIVTHEGEKLHPSEIQLLMFLYHVQDTNITAIATKMGLTKGAISQTLSRLQKKGIISKEMFPKKKNELQVQFTASGEQLMAQLNKGKKSLSVPGMITQSGVQVPTMIISKINQSARLPIIRTPNVFRNASRSDIEPPETFSNMSVDTRGKAIIRMMNGRPPAKAFLRSSFV